MSTPDLAKLRTILERHEKAARDAELAALATRAACALTRPTEEK